MYCNGSWKAGILIKYGVYKIFIKIVKLGVYTYTK